MTSYTTARPESAAGGPPLIDGPRWYRTRIRAWGPLLALLLPAVIGGVAYASLRLADTAWSGAVGLIGGVLAAPGLLAAGAPFGDRDLYPVAIAASAIVWMAVGFLASRRATRHPFATWADFWRHYFWMAGGIWAGAGIALAVATISIGEALF